MFISKLICCICRTLAKLTGRIGSISGKVTDRVGVGIDGVVIKAIYRKHYICGVAKTDANGYYMISHLPAGLYTVVAQGLSKRVSRHDVVVTCGANTEGVNFVLDVVKDFIDQLEEQRFTLEPPVSIEEAHRAARLFSVVCLMLAGLSKYKIGDEELTDVLGMLNLYYGLQDESMETRLAILEPDRLWITIEQKLKALAEHLILVQSDVDFLNDEARRQFNLGTGNGSPGNVQFPALFRRYVEIGTNSLLSINLRREKKNQFFDKDKLAQAYDLLRDLKGLILQIVRSLSKYGAVATTRVNQDWSNYQARALEVLAVVAQERVSSQQDGSPWDVLALLTGKNRDTEIAPYAVLARHGGKLLQYAIEIYLEAEKELDRFDRKHLVDLFQPRNREFWTTKIREDAASVERYPVANWR